MKGKFILGMLIVLASIIIFAGTVYAADFAPTLLKISAPETIEYDFDGSNLDIPVTVSGTTSSTIFMVYTKDLASSINKIQNGYLGWHYVNKVDTCVYAASPVALGVGSNEVIWDGKDNDGSIVPAGEYVYYIWGFDNVSQKTLVTKALNFWWESMPTILTHDVDGNPMAQPIIYQPQARYRGINIEEPQEYTIQRFVVGNDPEDVSLVETATVFQIGLIGKFGFQPGDHSMFFALDEMNLKNQVKKYQWVSNGQAELQTDWGEDGIFEYSHAHPGWGYFPGVISDGGDYLFVTNCDLSGTGTESELIYIDVDEGVELRRVDLSEWWTDLADAEAGGQASPGPSDLALRHNRLLGTTHSSCVVQLMNPYEEDDDEVTVWVNQNGDGTADHNFEEDSEKPWVCNDYNVGPYTYTFVLDDNLFSTFPSNDLGAVSFGLVAPDGTGLGYHAFSGEAATISGKVSQAGIDYDSAYDGIYQGLVVEEEGTFWGFIAQDSINGIISNVQIAVEEDAPSAFSVDQNSPNPFNPATTIYFSLAEAGNVTIDVYNVAGQKIDTIANEFVSAGSHSVDWDASGFSAGVYFYTVNSGGFSKTMKMTLLK